MLESHYGWHKTLKRLHDGELGTDEIGSAIVKLGKPYDAQRIEDAKSVVSSYLHHSDPWVRHEALWFLTLWGNLREYTSAALDALQQDPYPDNRSFAALCLGSMFARDPESRVVTALRQVVQSDTQERLTRLTAYGALLEVFGRSGSGDFLYGDDKDLADVDWSWLNSL